MLQSPQTPDEEIAAGTGSSHRAQEPEPRQAETPSAEGLPHADDRDPELADALGAATSLPRSELLPEVRRLVAAHNGRVDNKPLTAAEVRTVSGLCEVGPDGVTCIVPVYGHRRIYHGGSTVPDYASCVAEPTNTEERPEDAARRFAGELERLRTELEARSIPLLPSRPLDTVAVDTALNEIDATAVLPGQWSKPALQRFAGELWRLCSGLADRGIPLRDGPVEGAGVDTALAELDRLRRYIEQRDQGLQLVPTSQPSYRAFLGEPTCGDPACLCTGPQPTSSVPQDRSGDGVPEVEQAAAFKPACRVCGCTDDHACEGGCWWVPGDIDDRGPLCSSCRSQS